MKDGFFEKHKLKFLYVAALIIALFQIEPANLSDSGLLIAITVSAAMAVPLAALLLGCYLFVSSIFTPPNNK